jgi:hypothetical protein
VTLPDDIQRRMVVDCGPMVSSHGDSDLEESMSRRFGEVDEGFPLVLYAC